VSFKKMRNLFHMLVLYNTILSIIINPIRRAANSFAIQISPPESEDDYRQLASLLVSSFDAPESRCTNGDDNALSKLRGLQWNLYEKSLTEEFTYNRYASMARRMRGKKYCLFVAKMTAEDQEKEEEEEFLADDVVVGNMSPLKRRDNGVVGVIEMGMSLCPPAPGNATIDNCNHTRKLIPTPLIGVICVTCTHQKLGIGMKLINKCEEVARELWREQFICVDVEPDNMRALSLFEMGGYVVEYLDVEKGDVLMRNTTVLRRRRRYVKPHYLLRKRIRNVSDGTT
jgi:ribosomal protein S18 acetylase RimI-like enzyme